jgi:hypothetical protein
MAQSTPWRDAPLAGDDLYGDRDNLRRYRNDERDEHRRFALQYELQQQGRLPGQPGMIDYDQFDGGASDEGPNQPRAPTSNRGRGPKGYERADERIREDVCERLTDDPHIDASEIEVTVANGEVTLSGTLRSRNAKRRSEYVAEQARGVKDVHNLIRVVDEQTRQTDVARATQSKA